MKRVVSLAFLVGGFVLAMIGINNSSSDKALWMLVGGLLVSFLGLVATLRNWKHPAPKMETVYEQ